MELDRAHTCGIALSRPCDADWHTRDLEKARSILEAAGDDWRTEPEELVDLCLIDPDFDAFAKH